MIPKYKAWDEKHNEMIRVVSINFDEKFVRGLTAVESNLDMESSYNFEDIELLQSTGLKDINGVEIYEGDVVECFSEGLSVVEYRYGGFGLVCNKYFESFVNVLGGVEVIGNKYKHPHLIEE